MWQSSLVIRLQTLLLFKEWQNLKVCMLRCSSIFFTVTSVCFSSYHFPYFISFAKTTKKMRKDKVLVQSPSAFERMGSVTTILCHQTGIVTLNQMSVVDVWAGGIRMQDMDDVSQLPTFLKELIIEGIAQNTNGSVVFETVIVSWITLLTWLDSCSLIVLI
jgi:high-affinity K+ transport system ATPase subunit B